MSASHINTRILQWRKGAHRRLTSGSDVPTTVTSVVWSSWVCSLPGGQAFHNPEISTAVPVDKLEKRRSGQSCVDKHIQKLQLRFGENTLHCLCRLQNSLQWLHSRAIGDLCECKTLLFPYRSNKPVDSDFLVLKPTGAGLARLKDLRTSLGRSTWPD